MLGQRSGAAKSVVVAAVDDFQTRIVTARGDTLVGYPGPGIRVRARDGRLREALHRPARVDGRRGEGIDAVEFRTEDGAFVGAETDVNGGSPLDVFVNSPRD